MTTSSVNLENNRSIPAALYVVCILLLLDGVLVLIGSIFGPGQDIKTIRIAYAMGSLVLIATSMLIWVNHKWALSLSFVSAILITVDLVLEHVPVQAVSTSAYSLWEIARTLFNIGLYWAAFFWYKMWREANV